MTDAGKYPFEWKGRIPPAELPLDGFVLTYPDGTEIRPHEGCVVYLLPYLHHMRDGAATVFDTRRTYRAAFEDSEAEGLDLDAVDDFGLSMAWGVCQRAIAWPDVTDPITGEAYPSPDIRGLARDDAEVKVRAVYESLDDPFLVWLWGEITGIVKAANRPNASGASGATSSGSKVPKPRRKSS